MCGFAVIYKKTEIDSKDKEALADMSNAIRHRGPDEDVIKIEKNIGFAFRRLSIIDLQSGSQPFSIMGRYTGVYNGEVYNYRELREDLVQKGYTFKTNSEIEVILTLYHDMGPSFIKKLRGMFSFLIYDGKEDILMGGRDSFGIKPFYYSRTDNALVICSEMKGFAFSPGFKGFNVNKNNLQHYFTYQYVPEPDTISDNVKTLEAGHYFTCKQCGDLKPVKYEDNIFTPNSSPYEKKMGKVREALESSVKYHMISDVPVGTFLSSGVDSAIITSLASKICPGIKAFTVAFNEKEYSETDDAAQIAEHIDVEHIKINGTPQDFMDAYESAIYYLDSPTADPSAIAIYIISREAAKHVKVVLSGEGADELFGGYTVYRDGIPTQKIYGLPRPLKAPLKLLSNILPEGMRGQKLLYRGTTPLEKRFVGNAFIFNEKHKSDILRHVDPKQHFSDLTSDIYERVKDLSYPAQMQYCDINTWLRGDILVKGDRLSMAHGLEVRVPFIDREVFEAAKTLNDSDKFSENTTKYILRNAFRDIINEETFVRPKLGYPVPVRKWLKNEMYDWAKDIIKSSGADEYIKKDFALKMLEDHRLGKADNYRPLWVVLVFMTWHKLYVEEYESTLKKVKDKVL